MTNARVSIVRCSTYDRAEVHDAVARAIELIGGAARFLASSSPLPLGEGKGEGEGSAGDALTLSLSPRERESIGKNVLLKPNLLLPHSREKRVCTDPEVLRAVAEVLREAGAQRVAAGDSPGFGSGLGVMRRCGIDEALPGWVERVELDADRRCPSPSHPDLELAAAPLDAGLLVNVPKVKTHAYVGLTLATKNLFGCVAGTKKARWHLRAGKNRELFSRLLVEIAYSFRPGLVVADGVISMEGNGPSSGEARPLGLIVAGDDPVAVDAVIARAVGFPEEAVPTLAAARQLGAGQPDLKRIEILGERVEDVAVRNYRPAAPDIGIGVGIPRPLRGLLKSALTNHPAIDKALCRLCARCAEICPPKAISLDAENKVYPKIDRAKCIRCFCCQEVCPFGAIRARGGWLLRCGSLFRRR